MRRRTKVYISGLLIVCFLLVVGYFAFWRDRNVTVYDDAFKILDYRMSMGWSHTFYEGNQTLGRIKTRLRSAFGLKLIDPPRTILRTAPENLVLFVRYRGDLAFKEVDGLAAVVRNDEDFFEQMQGKNKYDRDRQVFTGCFILSKVPQNDDSLRVDFYLSSEHDKPIATLRVGQLNKHNKRQRGGPLNADNYQTNYYCVIVSNFCRGFYWPQAKSGEKVSEIGD